MHTEHDLGRSERVWIGGLLKPRKSGIFYQYYEWQDSAGFHQITFCRNDGGRETYSPQKKEIYTEHRPDSIDYERTVQNYNPSCWIVLIRTRAEGKLFPSN